MWIIVIDILARLTVKGFLLIMAETQQAIKGIATRNVQFQVGGMHVVSPRRPTGIFDGNPIAIVKSNLPHDRGRNLSSVVSLLESMVGILHDRDPVRVGRGFLGGLDALVGCNGIQAVSFVATNSFVVHCQFSIQGCPSCFGHVNVAAGNDNRRCRIGLGVEDGSSRSESTSRKTAVHHHA
jgi:hypothetical protein